MKRFVARAEIEETFSEEDMNELGYEGVVDSMGSELADESIVNLVQVLEVHVCAVCKTELYDLFTMFGRAENYDVKMLVIGVVHEHVKMHQLLRLEGASDDVRAFMEAEQLEDYVQPMDRYLRRKPR